MPIEKLSLLTQPTSEAASPARSQPTPPSPQGGTALLSNITPADFKAELRSALQ